MGDFYGAGQTRLRYAQFGKRQGKNGSLVFVNGKGENLLKYIELFYDFYLKGWSPIYTYDHRGQGFSPPFRPAKGQIYSLYKKDLRAFIQFVLNDPARDRSNMFLIAHSMGGTVVLDYLQAYSKENPFKAIALSAPMIKIKSHLLSFIENSALFSFRAFCFLFPCDWSFPSLRNRFAQDKLTASQPRYAFSKYVEIAFPQAKSRGTSLQWIIESFKIEERVMEKTRIQQIKTPLIILQSEKEFFVSNESQDILCGQIPSCCPIQRIKGKHEFFLETDAIRNQAIEESMSFFLNLCL